MTHNDEQIDLLIRRYAGNGPGAHRAPDHLDADEMNAFAEGSLPPAARAGYVAHLADCDECRKQVTQLAIASGAVARTEQSVANKPHGFWAALTAVFALPVLRYAAFAAIVVIVAGVGFVALRYRAERARLVAANEPLLSEQPRTSQPSPDTNGGVNNKTEGTRSNAVSAPTATSVTPPATLSDQRAKQDDDRVAENTTPPLQPMKEVAKSTEESEKKAEQLPVSQSQVAQSQPSYAPAPPGEAQSAGRVQSQTGGLALGGGFKTQPGQAGDKAASVDRERDMAKDARVDTANQQAPAARKADNDEKLKGPSRNTDLYANTRTENRVAAPKRAAPEASRSEDAPQTRSAGGHKFRRQGNSWVDQKFKSSMPLKNVSRGSDDFAALDAGLRSIAQQIGGEVIIVWKGKAYLIK